MNCMNEFTGLPLSFPFCPLGENFFTGNCHELKWRFFVYKHNELMFLFFLEKNGHSHRIREKRCVHLGEK